MHFSAIKGEPYSLNIFARYDIGVQPVNDPMVTINPVSRHVRIGATICAIVNVAMQFIVILF